MKSELRQAYELIKDEKRWTQGASGRNALGNWTVAYIHGDRLTRVAKELFPQYADDPGYDAVIHVNDDQGHEAILQVFEKAIVETEGSL